jgi:hypothetical protein
MADAMDGVNTVAIVAVSNHTVVDCRPIQKKTVCSAYFRCTPFLFFFTFCFSLRTRYFNSIIFFTELKFLSPATELALMV